MPHYLLPCSCGKKIEVALSQAGQMVTCVCGLQQEVPTMLGLKRLAVVEEARPKTARRAWSRLQGKLFVAGIVLLLVAGGISVFFGRKAQRLYSELPRINQKFVDQQAQKLNFDESLEIWNKMSDQHQFALGRDTHPQWVEIKKNNEQSRFYWQIALGFAGLALLGIVLAGSAFLVGGASQMGQRSGQ